MERKLWETPRMEIIALEDTDVICTSPSISIQDSGGGSDVSWLDYFSA